LPELKASLNKESTYNQNDFFSSSSINFYECLSNYFKPEFITDMKCENCSRDTKSQTNNSAPQQQKKRGFVKRQVIAKLPECLCIQIQRNSWSDQFNEMIKRTNHVKFPLSIKIDNHDQKSPTVNTNISFLSLNAGQFSLRQVGIGALLGGRSSSLLQNTKSDITTKSAANNHTQNTQASSIKTQSYELRSAVVHYGSAHSGHFVAYRKPLNSNPVNSSTDEWLQISDSDIKKVKLNTLLDSNVYMLFYDRANC
jgi:ubiquitin carboxyl-terminal hydrolase 30